MRPRSSDEHQAVIPGCAKRRPGIPRFRVRCFASPRNDVALFRAQISVSPRVAPEFCVIRPPNRGSGECRVPVAPAAARGVVVSTRVSHHGRTGTPGIPARNGFNSLFRALPGDRACLPPSLADCSANLTPASGRQDHTTSPSARLRARQSRTSRPSHPQPYVRDDRETPLCLGRDSNGYKTDLGSTASAISDFQKLFVAAARRAVAGPPTSRAPGARRSWPPQRRPC
jgi:hypothetical protein